MTLGRGSFSTEALAEHDPLIEKIVRSMNLPRDLLDVARNYGRAGVWCALQRRDKSVHPNQWGRFLWLQIKGAIVDGLRSESPSGVRGRLRLAVRLDAIGQEIAQEEERVPSLAECAAFAEVTLPEAWACQAPLSLAELDLDDFARYEDDVDLLASMASAWIEELPITQRLVVKYRLNGLSLREIGKKLDRSESRISQVARAAVKALRQRADTQAEEDAN